MLIRISKIIFFITLLGCTEISKSEYNSQELLECVLSEFINDEKPSKKVNVLIFENQYWTDSTSYISIQIDTKNLFDLEGEPRTTSFQGMNIYQYLETVDTNSYKKPNDLTHTMANRLKWKKEVKEKIENANNNISPPYDPPKIEFVYHTKRKCISEYFVLGSLLETLNQNCNKCK